MCGLIFCAHPSAFPAVIAANMQRAGRNKGAFTYTVWERGASTAEMLDTMRVIPDATTDFLHPGVTHLQAPTSSASQPHPASTADALVWHNGLFQPTALAAMQEATGCQSGWDTQLIAAAVSKGFDSLAFQRLGDIAGSFACIAYRNGDLYAFRNAVSPLFVSRDGDTLSSVPCDDASESVEPGVVWRFGEDRKWAKTAFLFATSHNPYGI